MGEGFDASVFGGVACVARGTGEDFDWSLFGLGVLAFDSLFISDVLGVLETLDTPEALEAFGVFRDFRDFVDFVDFGVKKSAAHVGSAALRRRASPLVIAVIVEVCKVWKMEVYCW